jgi:hypothetical protein
MHATGLTAHRVGSCRLDTTPLPFPGRRSSRHTTRLEACLSPNSRCASTFPQRTERRSPGEPIGRPFPDMRVRVWQPWPSITHAAPGLLIASRAASLSAAAIVVHACQRV